MKFSARYAGLAAAIAVIPGAALGGTALGADLVPEKTVDLPTQVALKVCVGAGIQPTISTDATVAGTNQSQNQTSTVGPVCTPIPSLSSGQLKLTVKGASAPTGFSEDTHPSSCAGDTSVNGTHVNGVEIGKTADTAADVDATATVTGITTKGDPIAKPLGPVHVPVGVPVYALACPLGQSNGNQASSTQPSGSQPSGSQPSGSQPSGSQPSGTQPSGTQPSGNQPSGSQPSQPAHPAPQPQNTTNKGKGKKASKKSKKHKKATKGHR